MGEPLSLLQRKFLDGAVGVFKPSTPVVTQRCATLGAALDTLKAHKIGCLLINDDSGSLCGVFTERDAVTRVALSGVDPESAKISDFMTANPVLTRPQTSVARLLYMMAYRNFRHAIIGHANTASGVISIKDVIDYVYGTLTRLLVERPVKNDEEKVESYSAVHRFFANKIEVLGPAVPISVTPEDTVRTALDLMCSKNIGSVTVVDEEGALCGIFTERDYLLKVARTTNDIDSTYISAIMTPMPETLQQTSTVALAFNTLSEGGFRHIPIVDGSETLVGILSARNFISALAQNILSDLEDHKKETSDT